MPIKICAISDTHYTTTPAEGGHRGEIADILLLRAAHRINRMIKPDVTVVLGDMIDDPQAASAEECRRAMRAAVDVLHCPTIVIPGNHDGDPDAFYEVFDRPPQHVDVKGVRFVWFLDPEEPDWNARRTAEDLERMTHARAGHDGPIVALQHVPLFSPGAADCPFNYTNADEVLAAMRASGIAFAISGHYHPGMDTLRSGGVASLAAPALCEPPFSFLEITIDGDEVSVRTHSLRMPEELQLVDLHVHTQFAYCSENMEMTRAMRLADDFGLAGVGFTEHSGQLYFESDTYWRGDFLDDGTEYAKGRRDRMADYRSAALEAGCPSRYAGLEVDCDFSGRAVIRREDRRRAGFLIGAIHALPELRKPEPDLARAADEFLGMLEKFARSGIHSLAHPFRVFSRTGPETAERVIGPAVRILRENGVAAELNFHNNEPRPDFVKQCLSAGVRLTFGSDAHNLYEIGEFAPHLELLRSIGLDGDLKDIMLEDVRGTATE